jgi:hypothetical protein
MALRRVRVERAISGALVANVSVRSGEEVEELKRKVKVALGGDVPSACLQLLDPRTQTALCDGDQLDVAFLDFLGEGMVALPLVVSSGRVVCYECLDKIWCPCGAGECICQRLPGVMELCADCGAAADELMERMECQKR